MGGYREREREREREGPACGVCMCEKVTVEIQIHKHSAIVSQWDFFCPLCHPLCDHRTPDRLEKIYHTSPHEAVDIAPHSWVYDKQCRRSSTPKFCQGE